jgi:hypothetical protein
MTVRYVLPALIAVLTASATVQAADHEGNETDLRLEGILLSEENDWDAAADSGLGSVNLSGDEDFDNPFRIGLAGVSHMRGTEYGPVGLVGGGALYYTRLETDSGATDDRYETLSLQLRIGLGIYVADFFHIEATPFAGIGGTRGKINGTESDIGLYWEYGISAGAFASLGGSFQLGLIGGWLHGEYDLDFDEDDNFPGPVSSVNVDLEHEGFFIGISVGSRL